jgi:hypothetical protein
MRTRDYIKNHYLFDKAEEKIRNELDVVRILKDASSFQDVCPGDADLET